MKMKLFKDFRSMLPSAVKAHLTKYFKTRIDQEGLNCYNEPRYRIVNALREVCDNCQGVNSETVINCYEDAKKP